MNKYCIYYLFTSFPLLLSAHWSVLFFLFKFYLAFLLPSLSLLLPLFRSSFLRSFLAAFLNSLPPSLLPSSTLSSLFTFSYLLLPSFLLSFPMILSFSPLPHLSIFLSPRHFPQTVHPLFTSDHEGSRRMKTELLIQMDGLSKSDDLVFLLAASNLPWYDSHVKLFF